MSSLREPMAFQTCLLLEGYWNELPPKQADCACANARCFNFCQLATFTRLPWKPNFRPPHETSGRRTDWPVSMRPPKFALAKFRPDNEPSDLGWHPRKQQMFPQHSFETWGSFIQSVVKTRRRDFLPIRLKHGVPRIWIYPKRHL